MIYPKEVIIAYIEKYITDDWSLSDGSQWINIDSVFVRDNKKKLGFNYVTNVVNDFKLGQSWKDFDKFVSFHQEISEANARSLVMKLYLDLKKNKKIEFTPIIKSIHKKPEEAVELENIRHYLVPPLKNFSSEESPLLKKALKFLNKRGIIDKHIRKFNLSFVDQENCWHCDGEDEDCPVCEGKGYNPYYGRIIIPTYENGRLVYFQARDFRGKELRYRNPSLEKKYVVSFYDLLKENDRIVIVEGPFDAMTLYDCNTTCIMGSSISDSQILKILKKHPKEIVIAPDYDSKPETREKIARSLAKNIKRITDLSDNKVPVYTYEWYKIPNVKDRLIDQAVHSWKYNDDEILKDINDFQITTIQETYLKNVSDVYERLREKLREIS